MKSLLTNHSMTTLIVSSVVMLVLDSIYLTIAGPFFQSLIKSIQGKKITLNYTGAVLCYLTLIIGLNYFVLLNNKLTKKEKIINALILGLVIYGVYEFTNHAILTNWNWKAVLLDTTWGGVLLSLTTIITLFLV